MLVIYINSCSGPIHTDRTQVSSNDGAVKNYRQVLLCIRGWISCQMDH